MDKAERDRLRGLLVAEKLPWEMAGPPMTKTFLDASGRVVLGLKPHDQHLAPLIIAAVNALPALLDALDAAEDKLRACEETNAALEALAGKANELQVEVDRLRQADEMDHRGVLVDKLLTDRARLIAERDQALDERDALKAEVERLLGVEAANTWLNEHLASARQDAFDEVDNAKRAEAERDQARARVAELEAKVAGLQANAKADYDRAMRDEQRIATLKAALRKYGRHDYSCRSDTGDSLKNHSCTCGFDAALAGGGQ